MPTEQWSTWHTRNAVEETRLAIRWAVYSLPVVRVAQLIIRPLKEHTEAYDMFCKILYFRTYGSELSR